MSVSTVDDCGNLLDIGTPYSQAWCIVTLQIVTIAYLVTQNWSNWLNLKQVVLKRYHAFVLFAKWIGHHAAERMT